MEPSNQPVDPQQPVEQPQWEGVEYDDAPLDPSFQPVTWKSAEYIEHFKTPMWYAVFVSGTVTITFIIYLLTKEILASLAILVVGGSVAFFASRPAAMRQYEITSTAFKINDKSYPFKDFKSFSVVEEGEKDSIWFKPIKRVAPFQIIYFDMQDEERIINALSEVLPHEPRELDSIDKLTRMLRF